MAESESSDARQAADGFIRLSLDEIFSIRLHHLMSRIDEEDVRPSACGSVTTITGYTEWVSTTPPTVTLGWDWSIEWRRSEMSCVRVGMPRSNVMLIDNRHHDYGWRANLVVLAAIVDAIAWDQFTARAIAAQYGYLPSLVVAGSACNE
ncbi:MAG: DUF4902 domain-containing protein [Sulfurifustis sp.]